MHLRLPCVSWALSECCFSYIEVSLQDRPKKSYEKIFDKSVSMGLVGAGYSDYDRDYVLRRYRP